MGSRRTTAPGELATVSPTANPVRSTLAGRRNGDAASRRAARRPAGQGGGQLEGLGPRDEAAFAAGRDSQQLVEADVVFADSGPTIRGLTANGPVAGGAGVSGGCHGCRPAGAGPRLCRDGLVGG